MTVQDLPLTGIDTGIVPLQSRQEPIPLTEQQRVTSPCSRVQPTNVVPSGHVRGRAAAHPQLPPRHDCGPGCLRHARICGTNTASGLCRVARQIPTLLAAHPTSSTFPLTGSLFPVSLDLPSVPSLPLIPPSLLLRCSPANVLLRSLTLHFTTPALLLRPPALSTLP